MNAKSMMLNTPRFFRVIEPGLYALCAAVLIGQMLLIEGVVSQREAGLAIAGVVFGLLASCAAAPLTALVQTLRASRDALLARTAEILPFIRRSNQTDAAQEEPRRAA